MKTDDIPIWRALHESVQWILYIPTVFGLSFAFAFLFNVVSTIRGDSERMFLYFQTPLNAGLIATPFVWLGLNLAPRVPGICAWLTYSLWSVLTLLSILRFFAITFIEERMSIQRSDVLETSSKYWLVGSRHLFSIAAGKRFYTG